MKVLFIVFIFSVFAFSHSLPSTDLNVEDDGKTSDQQIRVMVWNNYGGADLGDYRVLFITAPEGYLLGGNFELKQEKTSIFLNTPMFFRKGDAFFKNQNLCEIQVHKDSIPLLTFMLRKKTEDEHAQTLIIKGSSLLKVKKNQRL